MARTVGVVGGMGPRATADFFSKLIECTPAERDQDHLRVLIDNNPQIPDRSAFIFGRGPDPTPEMIATARNLEAAGADLLVIPCNTAHHFLEAIRRSVGIPVLDITEVVAQAAAERVADLRSVGVLATRATVATGLYERAFGCRNVSVLVPPDDLQERVNRAIWAVKAGRADATVRKWVRRAGRELVDRGVQGIVLGCTELPLVVDPQEWSVPVFDSTGLLARAAVRAAWEPEPASVGV
ncbi:MAG: amino acid racemase [Armatimonadota bacterium]|nr:amino acid racemase [Armatimonadota bacterium]MDR5696866.1 amino acid racemase [Armatimonadota bacterium]